MSTTSLPLLRPAAEPGVKLRSACDSCSIAKVRCDKKQPRCDRCRNNNFTCFYSPSRRFGKQSVARRLAANDQQWNPRTTLSPTEASITSPFAPMDNLSDFNCPPHAESMDATTSSISIDCNTLTSANTLSTNTLGEHLPQWNQVEPFDMFDASDFQFSVLTPTEHSQESFPVSHVSPNPASPCPIMGTFATTMPESLSSSFSGTTSTPRTWGSTESSRTSLHSDQQEYTEQERKDLPIHDCEARAMATLESLYYCKMVHARMPGQDPPNKTMSPVPTLDRMLYFNKHALATVTKLLDCPCARQVHLALLCMSILSKALFWYKLAVSDRFNAGYKMTSVKDGESNGPSPSWPNTHPPGRGVQLTPINIGVFNLEEEDQKALIRSVLLREVLKIDAIADKMGDLGSMRHSNSDEEDDFTVSWYGFAHDKFKADIQGTIKKIRRFGSTR